VNWRVKGGVNRSNRSRASKTFAASGLTAHEIQTLVGQTLKDVIAGDITPAIGNCVANLARSLIAVREVTELEARLTTLEAEIEVTNTGRLA
jgi:hypothetical protein